MLAAKQSSACDPTVWIGDNKNENHQELALLLFDWIAVLIAFVSCATRGLHVMLFAVGSKTFPNINALLWNRAMFVARIPKNANQNTSMGKNQFTVTYNFCCLQFFFHRLAAFLTWSLRVFILTPNNGRWQAVRVNPRTHEQAIKWVGEGSYAIHPFSSLTKVFQFSFVLHAQSSAPSPLTNAMSGSCAMHCKCVTRSSTSFASSSFTVHRLESSVALCLLFRLFVFCTHWWCAFYGQVYATRSTHYAHK